MNALLPYDSHPSGKSITGEGEVSAVVARDHGADILTRDSDARRLEGCIVHKEKVFGDDESNQRDTITYPEGGLKAWSVVLGSFSAMVACLGMMNTIGTFQAYISGHQLSHLDQGTIGWIFSLYPALAFFCGAQVGPVFDAKGTRMLVLAGSVLLILSIFILGSCTGESLQQSLICSEQRSDMPHRSVPLEASIASASHR